MGQSDISEENKSGQLKGKKKLKASEKASSPKMRQSFIEPGIAELSD